MIKQLGQKELGTKSSIWSKGIRDKAKMIKQLGQKKLGTKPK